MFYFSVWVFFIFSILHLLLSLLRDNLWFLSLLNGCLMFFLIICCWCIERDIFDLTPSYEFFLLSSHSQQFLGIWCINNGDICKTVLHFTLSLCYFVLGSNPGPYSCSTMDLLPQPCLYVFHYLRLLFLFLCLLHWWQQEKGVGSWPSLSFGHSVK